MAASTKPLPERVAPPPVQPVLARTAYRVPTALAPCDLRLDSNEGRAPLAELTLTPELLQRYPGTRALEVELARRHGVRPEEVLVTAGADDALQRLAAAYLAPGRELVLPVPTFEMIERYAAGRGATIQELPWPRGAFPARAVVSAITPRTALVAVVSPNNPTGAVATREDLEAVIDGRGDALVVVDQAYAEFGEADLTRVALERGGAVVLRTFSKAWGLAGLRVGYALGSASVLRVLRAAGNPYPAAGPSVALCAAALQLENGWLEERVRQVADERRCITRALRRSGWSPQRSEGNFVLARGRDPLWLRDGLAGQGIAVRTFPGRRDLEDAVRITCPCGAEELERLERALDTVLAPEALLFDLDGVLADVSGSYREAIRATARSFGVELEAEEIAAAKRAGNANDDWSLTRRLLQARGVDAPLEEVTRRFEELYQGSDDLPGLRTRERLLPTRALLEQLAAVRPLGVVTGRPRSDAERFLREAGVRDCLQVVVSREDAPLKPDPAPLRLALELLGVERAWYLGDTVDDARAARAAGLLPLGVVAPGDDPTTTAEALGAAGAARTLDRISDLLPLLP